VEGNAAKALFLKEIETVGAILLRPNNYLAVTLEHRCPSGLERNYLGMLTGEEKLAALEERLHGVKPVRIAR